MADNAAGSLESAYDGVVAWWRSLDDVDRHLYLEESFPLHFSYNSGKIENDEITYHDTKEIFERGRIVGFTGDPRTLFEIANLKTAWREARALAASQDSLSSADLLHLHAVLP